jgi:hypothetical protein
MQQYEAAFSTVFCSQVKLFDSIRVMLSDMLMTAGLV